LTRSLYTC